MRSSGLEPPRAVKPTRPSTRYTGGSCVSNRLGKRVRTAHAQTDSLIRSSPKQRSPAPSTPPRAPRTGAARLPISCANAARRSTPTRAACSSPSTKTKRLRLPPRPRPGSSSRGRGYRPRRRRSRVGEPTAPSTARETRRRRGLRLASSLRGLAPSCAQGRHRWGRGKSRAQPPRKRRSLQTAAETHTQILT